MQYIGSASPFSIFPLRSPLFFLTLTLVSDDFEDIEDLDPMEDFEDLSEPFVKLPNPHEMTAEQWEGLNGLAIEVQESIGCDFTKAVVIAFVYWINEGAEAEGKKH